MVALRAVPYGIVLGMELVRYARIGVLTGLFAIPFVVLLVSESLYFPFITGKGFAFRILVEIVFALWVVLALASPEYRPKKSPALFLGLAFVVAIGVSTALAENPVKAFWSNFERMEGYVTILHLAAYVLVLTSVMRVETLWRNLVYTTLGVATIVGAYSVFQLLGFATINQGGLRIDATLGNATYFAVYMLVHAFLALYAYIRWSENRWTRIALGTLVAFFSILVFYSATRGSILGLVGGFGLAGLIIVFSKGVSQTVRYTGMAFVGIVIALALGFYAVKDTAYVQEHPILSRIATISLASGETRFTIWSMALEGVAERPVFGWGQEGFNYIFNTHYRPELVNQEPWFDRAHNVILDWLVAGGVVGMLLYLSLYAVLLYYLWRPGNTFSVPERAVLTGLIAAYGFHNIFVFDNLLSYILFMLVFSYITVRSTPHAAPTGPVENPGTELVAPHLALPGALIVLCVVMYAVNWSGYASASGIIQGLSPHQEGIQKNLEYFLEASGRTGMGYQEVGEQFLQFALQIKAYNYGDPMFQNTVVGAARSAFEGVLAQAPHDARLLVFYGSFLRQVGDLATSREYMERALLLSPKKQSILLEYGSLELVTGKYESAISRFEEISKTNPTYARVHVMLASSYLLAGQREAAERVLISIYGTDEPEDTTIANAYLQSGDYAKALRIAELIVTNNPTAESLRFLAGVYLEGGEREKAVAALERAKTVDPRVSAEADAYIREIQGGRI